jgi:hypothetical protein
MGGLRAIFKYNNQDLNIMDKFPRLEWILKPYAELLGVEIADLLQVHADSDLYTPPFYVSRKEYEASPVVRASWGAGNPRRKVLEFNKEELTPIEVSEIYYDTEGPVILYVDDGFTHGSRNEAWYTLMMLQEKYSILGGDPDRILELFATKQVELLICDHNLNWPGTRHPPFGYGYEFIEYLRKDHAIPPVILHSDKNILPFQYEKMPEFRAFAHKDGERGRNYLDVLVEEVDKVIKS